MATTEVREYWFGYGTGPHPVGPGTHGDVHRCADCGDVAVADLVREFGNPDKLESVTRWAKCDRHAMYAKRRKDSYSETFRVVYR